MPIFHYEDEDFNIASGAYDMSNGILVIPSAIAPPAIPSKLLDGSLTVMENEVVWIPASGVIMCSSGNSDWFALQF